jgi:tRNA A-37 threonylcarbamoyl transferase component Bud32
VNRLGDYDVHRIIGEGGMGCVYEATERLSGRKVALKVLHPELARTEEARQRFFREMQILAGLSHPNIVKSFANAEIDGKLVMVLEYLDGRNLREELANGRLGVARALDIAISALSALSAAHEREPPVVHRDLKPENLMVLRDGSIKIMDFGIAKVLDDKQQKTRTTQIMGTAQYMSPEQIEGRGVSPRVDLYALGLVLHEMLGGQPTFGGSSILALIREQCEKAPPPLPAEVEAALPAAARALLFAMLEKDPAKRPGSAREALAVLQGARSSAAATNPSPAAARGARRAEVAPDTIEIIERLEKRRTLLWVVGGVALLLGVGALALLATRSPDRTREETDAERTKVPPAPAIERARTDSDGQMIWQAPLAWQRSSSDERGGVASYLVPRAAGDAEDASLTIKTSSSDTAETRARLRSQFDVCGPQCDVLRSRDVGGASVGIIELSGTFWGTSSTGKPKLGSSMVVAVVPFAAESFYEIRLTGPEKTVTAARPDFDALIGSLRRTSAR